MIVRPATPTRREGFTVLELLLALALGALVVSAAMGVFTVMIAGEKRHSQSFDNRLDLLILQQVLRRATDSMVAAAPLDDSSLTQLHGDASEQAAALIATDPSNDPPDGAEGEESDGPSDEEAMALVAEMLGGDQNEQMSTLEQLREAAGGDQEVLTQLLLDTILFDMPNFELYYDTNEYDRTLPVLELVLQSSPLPADDMYEFRGRPASMEPAGYVRGRFEFMQFDDELILMWQPIEPVGMGVVLLEGVDECEIEVLVPRTADTRGMGWVGAHAAYMKEQFPPAIRFIIWMQNGDYIDWLFETGVTTPDAVR